MLLETARWLTSDEGRDYLATGYDPDSLGDAERLRRVVAPEKAAAVLHQLVLRRRARTKFGDRADTLFLTSSALEQATRPDVAAWRASRFVDVGATRVVDLGCGIGADSLALIGAGLDVRAVEVDPVTAAFASANLGIEVDVADATTAALGAGDAVFCDPARRTALGRSWRVEDFTPPWGFVTSLLDDRVACLKLGPGVPYLLLPDEAATTWVSHRGDVVEASVWSVGEPGSRSALLLPDGFELSDAPSKGCRARPSERDETLPGRGGVVLEPDGAIIRAGLVDHLASMIGARRIHPDVAYLWCDHLSELPSRCAAACFEVIDVLPYDEKTLRAYVRDHAIGTLEIKKRGIGVDPAKLRNRLRPKGRSAAILILTPTPTGGVAFVARRV